MSLLVVGTDVTIVNVALPAIGRGLHASLSGLQWSVDAYTLVIGSLLMASGSMGDRFGRRRVFQTGLALCPARWRGASGTAGGWLRATCPAGLAGRASCRPCGRASCAGTSAGYEAAGSAVWMAMRCSSAATCR